METGAIVTLLIKYRYWIIFPVACVEGPILSFLIGTLSGLGYFNPYLAFPILLAGDLIPDTFFYYLGLRGRRAELIAKYASKIGVTEGHFETIDRIWQTHPRKTMLMAKFALGLAAPFLVTAGLAKIPRRIFYGVAIPSSMLMHAALLFLGYHSAASYELVKSYVGHVQFFIVTAIVFALVYYVFARYMRQRFLKEEADGTL